MKYREEIDGLRAVAVLPVVLFHAGFESFAGGFVGVDVFFVISGYLITSIILKEKAENKFSILNFYERRSRRILPALSFVMLSCIPLAWIWMAPHQIKDFAQSLVATTFFSSNIFFFLETDYFNEVSEKAPLLHTWSLAVEEQYYLLFPPFILVTWKLGKRTVISMLAAISILSIITAQILSISNPTANFYLLPSRVWELLLGVFVAYYLIEKKSYPFSGKLIAEVFSLLGFGLIIYSVFTFDEFTPFPSLWALMPTVGTVLIILFATSTTSVGKILSLKMVVGLGLISYSIYLWHQPLFAFARITTLGDVSSYTFVGLALLSILLALLSYKYIESPFRNKTRISKKAILAAVFSYATIFPAIGLVGHLQDGFIEIKMQSIDPELQRFIINRDAVLSARRITWNEVLGASEEPFDLVLDKKRVLILGDSKSQDLYVALELNADLYPELQFRRIRIDDGCMRSLNKNDTEPFSTRTCQTEFDNLLESQLIDQAEVIILSNTWRLLTNESVSEFIRSLAGQGKKIAVLGTGNFNDLTSLSMIIAKNRLEGDALESFLFNNIRQDQRRVYMDLVARLSDLENIAFLDKLELFCDFEVQRCSLFSDQGVPYIYDSGHVTVNGAVELGERIFAKGWMKFD